jgi:hypothetical protein
MTTQPWIYSRPVDGWFILAPALLITALVLLCRPFFMTAEVSPALWVLLIVGVDVAHVYSTLYRTYFDREEFRARQSLYVLVPLLGWLIFAALYSIGSMVFWRALAYLAVFHFMRQQYGLMMIYGRREPRFRLIDKAAIYLATLYPLVYWHTHLRNFHWFIEGDFVSLQAAWLDRLVLGLYLLAVIAYAAKEVWLWRQTRRFNWPRNLLLAGTMLSWGVGIVALNSDLAFTATNVIAHGIPYMALIWIYGRNHGQLESGKTYFGKVPLRRFFTLAGLPVFIGILVLLAYGEEGLWDGLIWTEHKSIFGAFSFLPVIDSRETLIWLVPLLALPQITHYFLDAFIWRLKGDTPWKKILFYKGYQTQ